MCIILATIDGHLLHVHDTLLSLFFFFDVNKI